MSMRVHFEGESRWTPARIDAAREAGWHISTQSVAGADDELLGRDAVVIALSGNDLIAVAEETVRSGRHVFIDSHGPASVRASERLAMLASESGVHVGIARPLRFRRSIHDRTATNRARILRVDTTVDPGDPVNWTNRLIDVADLCGSLCGTWGARRIDAEAVRHNGPTPSALAVAIRFQNRAVAHILVRHSGDENRAARGIRVVEASDDTVHEEDWVEDEELIRLETTAFLEALAAGDDVPVSLSSALGARRVVEEIMERLR